jgi:hypothetical protein
MVHSATFALLDFSHLGARHNASAEGSVDVREIFSGRSRTPTRKKAPTFEDRDRLLAVRAGAADAPTKRCYLQITGLKAS